MGNTCCACAKPTKDSDFTVTNQTPAVLNDYETPIQNKEELQEKSIELSLDWDPELLACKPTKDSDFTVTNQTPPEVQDPSPKKVDFANGESEIVVALGHEASNAIQHPPLFENQVQDLIQEQPETVIILENGQKWIEQRLTKEDKLVLSVDPRFSQDEIA